MSHTHPFTSQFHAFSSSFCASVGWRMRMRLAPVRAQDWLAPLQSQRELWACFRCPRALWRLPLSCVRSLAWGVPTAQSPDRSTSSWILVLVLVALVLKRRTLKERIIWSRNTRESEPLTRIAEPFSIHLRVLAFALPGSLRLIVLLSRADPFVLIAAWFSGSSLRSPACLHSSAITLSYPFDMKLNEPSEK